VTTRCEQCRHHSIEKRTAPESGVVDPEMEIVEFRDDPQPYIVCRVKEGYKPVGFVHETPAAGADCTDFVEGSKRPRVAFSFICRCPADTVREKVPLGGDEYACGLCGGAIP